MWIRIFELYKKGILKNQDRRGNPSRNFEKGNEGTNQIKLKIFLKETIKTSECNSIFMRK